MPYTDFTVDPPITILSKKEVESLPLLKEMPVVEYDTGISDAVFGNTKIVGSKYDYNDLYNHAKHMMQLMTINYDKLGDCPKLEDIPEDIKVKLKPFAHFLAIIDGNAFAGLIDQYIPEVYAFMTFGGYAFVHETLEKIYDKDA